MNRTSTALLAAVASAASLLAVAPARAQMTHVPDSDWRQGDRHDALIRAAAAPTFMLELRFGPYLPGIDAYVPGGATPFKDVFGLQCGASPPTVGSVTPRVLVGAEIDYLPLRIPYVGAIGPGVGWSFTSFSNNAQFTNLTGSTGTNTNGCSPESTTLTIMPMHASFVLRADELMRRTGVPIVPYGKVGVGVAWWRASTDTGTETICGTKTAPAACTTSNATVIGNGDGLTPSVHFAVGAMLALNFLEPQASARLDASTGVHHAYVFGEYYNDQLTLNPNVLHVGVSSFTGGIAVDF
jgi:hypothetical protein